MLTRRHLLAAGFVLAAGSAMAADKYTGYPIGLDSPAIGGFAITPSDVTVFAQPTRAVWVGSTGNVAVHYVGGTTDTLIGVPTGFLLPIRVDQVLSTGTTASGISGLY